MKILVVVLCIVALGIVIAPFSNYHAFLPKIFTIEPDIPANMRLAVLDREAKSKGLRYEIVYLGSEGFEARAKRADDPTPFSPRGGAGQWVASGQRDTDAAYALYLDIR